MHNGVAEPRLNSPQSQAEQAQPFKQRKAERTMVVSRGDSCRL